MASCLRHSQTGLPNRIERSDRCADPAPAQEELDHCRGGNKSQVSNWIDGELAIKGWVPKNFDTRIVVDEVALNSPTHEVDCFKNRIALEIEWNNKDPFYDRDLNNFRLLFDLRAISAGIIITRCDELQDLYQRSGKGQILR